MKKFCCATWQSSVEQVKEFAGQDIEKAGLLKDALVEAISLWPSYCPSCGLSLSSPDISQGVNIKHTVAQSTHPLTCGSCKGNGHAGGIITAKAKCTPCLGTGKITPKKNNADALVKIEELKAKIRKENKPVDPESLNPKLIK